MFIGKYLAIDFIKVKKLPNKKELIDLVKKISKKLKMKIIYSPVIVEGNKGNEGLTCFTIIDKSHIAIHTFERNKVISIDIYSCKDFNEKLILDLLKKSFGKNYKIYELTR